MSEIQPFARTHEGEPAVELFGDVYRIDTENPAHVLLIQAVSALATAENSLREELERLSRRSAFALEQLDAGVQFTSPISDSARVDALIERRETHAMQARQVIAAFQLAPESKDQPMQPCGCVAGEPHATECSMADDPIVGNR